MNAKMAQSLAMEDVTQYGDGIEILITFLLL